MVGPRPCLLSQTEVIRNRDNYDVYSISPGITGLSQVLAIDMSNPKLLSELDGLYLKITNVIFDIKLIIFTLKFLAPFDKWENYSNLYLLLFLY